MPPKPNNRAVSARITALGYQFHQTTINEKRNNDGAGWLLTKGGERIYLRDLPAMMDFASEKESATVDCQ